MKKISLLLVSCFLMQSLAWAGPKTNLKTVLDDYRYAVTVEWDQKDQAQLESYQQELKAGLKELAQEGLSHQDIYNYLQANAREWSLNEQTLASLESNGELNIERTEELLKNNSHLLYKTGANWAPAEEILLWGLGAFFVIEIIVLIATSKEDPCPNPDYHPNDVPYGCIY